MEPSLPFTILFEDAHLLVFSKPAGLLSQGDVTRDPSVVDLLRQYFGRHYVGLIHRLDRGTSGLMVVAKRSKAAERLSRALQSGELVRKYQAWIQGALNQEEQWEDWLVKDPTTNHVAVLKRPPFHHSISPALENSPKLARLTVTPLKQTQGFTLAEFNLDTGRSHQIRAQCAAHQHPILGDRKYNGLPASRMALHSTYLRFSHPMPPHEVLEFNETLPDVSVLTKKE